MTIQDAIIDIISKIPKGMAFDSHYVIDQLIMNYSDEYLDFASKFGGKPNSTNTTHMSIGSIIGKVSGVSKLPYQSFSLHIHKGPGLCQLWLKS